MPPQILDGKLAAQALRQELKTKVNQAINLGHRPPKLVALMVGEHPASLAYVRNKMKACEEVGFHSQTIKLPTDTDTATLKQQLQTLNQDPEVDGYILQLPLPPQLNEQELISCISPDKDADGFHPLNMGKLSLNQPSLIPATPYGILLLLTYYQINTQGKHCLIIGRSNIVGRPLSILLSNPPYNATVTLCHSRSVNIPKLSQSADVLIAAIGKAQFIDKTFVQAQSIVIDVGINTIEGRKGLFGDVDFDNLAPEVQAITPVPGGVGPMTIVGLLYNTWAIYQKTILKTTN